MMRKFVFLFVIGTLWLFAHDLHYSVKERKCVEVGLSFETGKDDFSYQKYEIYAPGEKIPFMVGRTDKHSRLFFLPDRPGEWRVKVMGEDGHGKEFKIDVDRHLTTKEKSKEGVLLQLVKILGGVVLIFVIFQFLKTKERS